MDDSLDDKWMVRVRLELEDKIKERREEREERGEMTEEETSQTNFYQTSI